MESASSTFSSWSVFYTLTGSSAAALTGLTFVVITLMQDSRRRVSTDGIPRVSAATIAHFTAALMISGILCAPWPALIGPETLLALIGAAGVSYQCRLLMMSLESTATGYEPDAEDWTWYTFLPMFAYALVLAGAIVLAIAPRFAAYAPAAGVALLILIGIHNSWDIVTYIAFLDRPQHEDDQQ